MLKKKLLVLTSVTIASLLLLSCGKENAAHIKGKADGLKGKTVYLERIPSPKILDSAKVNGNGDFSLKLNFLTDEPCFVVLKTDSVTMGTLLLEKGEEVGFTYVKSTYEVAGSNGSTLVKELSDNLGVTAARYDSIVKAYEKSYGGNPTQEAYEKLTKDVRNLFIDQKRSNIRFIMSNPKSYASIMAIYQRFPGDVPMFGTAQDLIYYQTLLDSLQQEYPQSSHTAKLKSDLEKIKREKELQEKFENVNVVDGVPEISLPDKNGKEVALSSLRGKVVLLYFWASTFEGSQLDNRELLNLYEKFKSKDFTIYQVSLDTERAKWIKAIEVQELPWVNVCDGYGVNSYAVRLYNVQAIPTSYLIGKNGEVLAKNLHGDTLEKKVAEACR